MRGSITKYSVVVTDTYFFYFNASDIFFISNVDMVNYVLESFVTLVGSFIN